MYFKVNKDGEVIQGRLYLDRKSHIDFDWGHKHSNTNGDGRTFDKGKVHVQVYTLDGNGRPDRQSDNARLMFQYRDEEIWACYSCAQS